MVVESRALSRVTIKDSQRMGNVQNTFDSVYGSKLFSNMDLFSGYNNIPIAEEDRSKTAFVVPPAPGSGGSLFQFDRMCFGINNAGATFCRLVDKIFGDIKQRYCLLCIDDFSVHSKTSADHLLHSEEVLK